MRLAALLFIAAIGPRIPLTDVRHTGLYWNTPLAIAPAGDGFVLAWSMPDTSGRFHVLVAKAGGAPREMPEVSPRSRYAADPSIAPFGDGFLVAWTEDCGALSPSCTALRRLDRSLSVVGPDYPLLPSGSPAIVRTTGGHTVIAAGRQVWPVDPDGSLGPARSIGDPVDSAAVNASGAIVAASRSVTVSTTCSIPLCGGGVPKETRTLLLTWFGEGESRRDMGTFIRSSLTPPFQPSPAIASNGCCFLMTWMDRGALMAALAQTSLDAQTQMNAPKRIAFPIDDVRASVASDGERFVIVWPAGQTIGIAAVASDASSEQSSVAVPNAAKVNIAAIRRGLFVLVYDDGVSAAARLIDFRIRERAVR